MSLLESVLARASHASEMGDVPGAMNSLQSVLAFPESNELSDAEFAQALAVFARLASGNTPEVTSRVVGAAAAEPTNPATLFRLGHQLFEVGLYREAATALVRADAIDPQHPQILTELVCALEMVGLNRHAFEALHRAPRARANDWLCRYLYSFNALMSGRLGEARTGFAELGPVEDPRTEPMRDILAVLLARFDSVASYSRLHEQDLRGWHYVLHAGVLTHISPHGFAEGMNGRYALIQDNNELINEGIARALLVLQAWNLSPAQLVYSRDRSSEILAHAWNKRTGVALKQFDASDATKPGLFLAYDLAEADSEFCEALQYRNPQQALVSHMMCWTNRFPMASDITTCLYEVNVAPWGEGRVVGIDPATQQAIRLPADFDTPSEALADLVVQSRLAETALDNADELVAFAANVGPPAPSGRRNPFYIGGPVSSRRFN